MIARRLGLALALALVTDSMVATAQGQVLGVFSWQTQPYCNVVTLRIEQLGGAFQLVGSDDLCGGGLAPVTGTAVIVGGNVSFGFEVNLPTGRAAHVSATISTTTLAGPWIDSDGNTGTFVFGAASTGGSARPVPFSAGVITAGQLAPAVYAGTGAATTISRSDHTHDDRYFTKAQGDARYAESTQLLSAFVNANGTLGRGMGVTSSQRTGTGIYVVGFNRDVSTCVFSASVVATNNSGSVTEGNATVANLSANSVKVKTNHPGFGDLDASFHLIVICP